MISQANLPQLRFTTERALLNGSEGTGGQRLDLPCRDQVWRKLGSLDLTPSGAIRRPSPWEGRMKVLLEIKVIP
jgi:hypothetical protein